MVGGGQAVDVDQEPAGAGTAQQGQRGAGRARVHPGLRALGDDGADDRLEQRGGLGRVHGTVPPEARRGRHRRGQHRGQPRLVELDDQGGRRRHPAAHVAHVVAQALGQRLREVASRPVVAEHEVAARLLHGGRERPGAGDLQLHDTGVPLAELLERVEVLAEQAAGAAVVEAGAARAAGEPPPGGLQVDVEPRDDGQGAPGHGGGGAAARLLGHGREVGQLVEHDLDRLAVARTRRLVAGHRPDRGRQHAHDSPPVSLMVAEPTTRLPS